MNEISIFQSCKALELQKSVNKFLSNPMRSFVDIKINTTSDGLITVMVVYKDITSNK